MCAAIRMLVGGGDNSAALHRFFIHGPTGLVWFAPDLHQSLVLVPATNAPDGLVSGELLADVGVAVAGIETIRNSRRSEYEEDSLVVKSGLHAEVAAPADAQAIE